jgi:hypothetical protein
MRTLTKMTKWIVLICFAMLIKTGIKAQGPVIKRTCGSETGYNQLMAKGGDFAKRYEQLERFTLQYRINLNKGEDNKGVPGPDGARASAIIIPVVVHVLWNATDQNITDAQINNQIEILNRDYRNLNTETVPAEFTGVRADMQIQFQLAVRDPNCVATTGIDRRNTTVTQFTTPWSTGTDDQLLANNPVKSNGAGGLDAWPRDRYFNIWVCKLAPNSTGGILFGYSSFPEFPANVDGVVVDYRCFGSTGTGTTLNANTAGGRTLVHETGHWLNLFHIFQPDGTVNGCFGTTATDCSSSGDHICDTPPQNVETPLGACPAATRNTCTETPTDHNDMWENYMDYSSDFCYAMFTSGQKERVDACLYGSRAAILSSDALIPVGTGTTANLWSQDKPDDVGAEPNIISDVMYVSEDIWVRNAAGTTDQQHQNPVSNSLNHVYVRIRNSVCGTNGTATVRLFWAKASSALSWPAPWDGTIAGPPAMGGEVGTVPVTVTGTTTQIVDFSWNTPNISDYATFGADAGHFCLLARIETAPAPGFGLTSPPVAGDLWNYVKNNNKIVWKNVEVVASAGGSRAADVIVGNMDRSIMRGARLVFTAIPDDHKVAFTDVGKIRVKLGEKLYSIWERAGKKAEGVSETNEKFTLLVEKSGAYIGGLSFEPNQIAAIRMNFEFTKHVPWAVHKLFHVNVEQFALDNNGTEKRVGGQDFNVRNPRTSEDDLQPAATGKVPGKGLDWWWWLILILIIFIGAWLFLRKK